MYFDWCGIKRSTFWSLMILTLSDSGAVLHSPLLNGIDVSEEQQDLPGAALLSHREKQVVAGDTQRPSAGRMQRLSEHHILHVGRLDVLRKLHSPFLGKKKKPNSSLQNFYCGFKITSSTLVRNWKLDPCARSRVGTTADAPFQLADKESINSPFFLHIVRLFFTQVVEHRTAIKDGSARFLRGWHVSRVGGWSFWTLKRGTRNAAVVIRPMAARWEHWCGKTWCVTRRPFPKY